jgi:hypothetical protein
VPGYNRQIKRIGTVVALCRRRLLPVTEFSLGNTDVTCIAIRQLCRCDTNLYYKVMAELISLPEALLE